MISESAFSKKIRALLKENKIFHFAIENASNFSGTPDIYLECGNVRFLELKFHKTKRKTIISEKTFYSKLRQSQIAFGKNYNINSKYLIVYACYCVCEDDGDYIACFTNKNKIMNVFQKGKHPDYVAFIDFLLKT